MTLQAIFAISALVVAVVSTGELARLWQTPLIRTTYTDELVDGGAALREHAQLTGDWVAELHGLALKTGAEGSVTWRIELGTGDSAQAVLSVRAPGGVTNRFEVSTDGEQFSPIGTGAQEGTIVLRLRNAGWLRLSSRSDGTANDAMLVLDRVQITLLSREASLPNLPVLFLLALLPVFAFAIVETAGAPRLAVVAALVTLTAGLSLRAAMPMLTDFEWDYRAIRVNPPLLACGAFWAILFAVAAARGRLTSDRARLAQLSLATVIAFAMVMRWGLLVENANLPLQPDAETVLLIVRDMAHPYDTSVREPLWPCLVKVFVWMFGHSALAPRYFSMTFSIALIWMTWRFAHDYTGSDVLALLASLSIALHALFMQSAGLGLRTELFAVLLLAFSYFVFVPGIQERHRIAGLTATMALAALTILTSVLTLVVLLGWCWFRQRVRPIALAIPMAATALVVAPNLAYNQQRYGHPTYFNSVSTGVWYRNYEFVIVKGIGCEGCPTREEFFKNSYGGSPTTTGNYIFAMHSFTEVVTRLARGYYELYLRPNSQTLSALLGTTIVPVRFLWLAGLGLLLASPWRELLIVPIVSINALAFLIPIGLDARLVVHPAPFVAIALALPLWKTLSALEEAAKRRLAFRCDCDHADSAPGK